MDVFYGGSCLYQADPLALTLRAGLAVVESREPRVSAMPTATCQESGPSHFIPGEVVVTCALWLEWKQPYSSGYGCPDEV